MYTNMAAGNEQKHPVLIPFFLQFAQWELRLPEHLKGETMVWQEKEHSGGGC